MLSALIVSLISFIKFRMRLKKCLVIENTENVTLFEYKGKAYDRKKFIRQEAEYMLGRDISHKTIREQLEKYESDLVKSKTPDFDMAMIEVYKLVLSRM